MDCSVHKPNIYDHGYEMTRLLWMMIPAVIARFSLSCPYRFSLHISSPAITSWKQETSLMVQHKASIILATCLTSTFGHAVNMGYYECIYCYNYRLSSRSHRPNASHINITLHRAANGIFTGCLNVSVQAFEMISWLVTSTKHKVWRKKRSKSKCKQQSMLQGSSEKERRHPTSAS